MVKVEDDSEEVSILPTLRLPDTNPDVEMVTMYKFPCSTSKLKMSVSSALVSSSFSGSALIVISNMPPMVYGISLIGMIGFLAAGFMGVWLLVAIIKKGRL